MKTEQLILYRDFEEGDLLTDMVWLAENYADDFYNLSDKAGLLYDCMHRLLDMAGRYGFYGNLWHCYLANLLVNKENSYSCSAEIRGSVEGSVNLAALHDIRIFKEFYDYDLQTVAKVLGAEEFSTRAIRRRAKYTIPVSATGSAILRSGSVWTIRRKK